MGFLIPVVIIVLVDQVTKQAAWAGFDVGRQLDLIPGVLRINLVKNSGAAFGMFEGGRVFFILAGLIAVAVISYVGWRLPKRERLKRVLLGLILGGAIGNLIDRVYDGAVIDFIEMGVAGYWWPVYNVADIAVSVGAVLLLFHVMFSNRRVEPPAAAEATGSADESPGSPPETRPGS